MNERVEPQPAEWELAYRWLAGNELGTITGIEIPAKEPYLRERTKALAVLFNLLPRTEVARLPAVVTAWTARFAGELSVSLAQLRQVAREVLKSREDHQTGDDLWQRALQLSRLPVDFAGATSRPAEGQSQVSVEGQQRCAAGLLLWFRDLQTNPHWNTLPGIVPGEASRPLQEVYVELSAIEDLEVIQPAGTEAGTRSSFHSQDQHAPAISVEAMIARIIERCIVVGDPGSGKTTLVKWLVWATFHGKVADFDLAIEVKLSTFAAALALDANLTPLEFFFRSVGLSEPDAGLAAAALRHTATESQRCLLLFDGWDEVAVAQRAIVKAQLAKEDRAFITILTSRPAGMPRQLLEGQRVACYRIAGLTPAMAQELATKLLRQMGKVDRLGTIWGRIQEDTQLQALTENPFLLSLLVCALAESGYDFLATRSAIYRQITAWIRRQYEEVCLGQNAFTSRHLEGLAKLSFQLLNDPQTPRYLFTRRELEACLPEHSAEPVFRSRFVTQPHAVFDEFTVLHATLQEFLAAEFAAGCPPEMQREFLNRFFGSASRFIILEFFAGLGGEASRTCQELAQHWWRSRDRFMQVTLRIARLTIAGRWASDDLGRSVRDALWNVIADESEMELCQSVTRVFAALDSADLVRRAQNSPPSSWAINCILEAVPASVARTHRLDQLLVGEWRDVAGLDYMGGATDVEREELHRQLEQLEAPPGDLREAILQVGASRDESAIPQLSRIVKNNSLTDGVREEAITSIGRIGGNPAVQTIRGFLLSGTAISDTMARMTSIMFVQPSSHRLNLDPSGRDQLWRRLAAIAPTAPRVENYLTALEQFPIRDGAEFMAELATSPASPIGVRRKAITVLASVTDRRLLARLVSKIETEPQDLIPDWLNLALKRSLPVPVPWLQNRVSRSRNRVQRHQLLSVLCRVLAHSDLLTRSRQAPFLDDLVLKAFHDTNPDNELALALVGAINQVSSLQVILFSHKSRKAALRVLGCVSLPTDSQHDGPLLLAVAIARHFRDQGARGLLVAILEQLQRQGVDANDRIACAVADCLAELAPAELLRLPADGPGVMVTLRSRSLKEGWLVYADRILNAEGGEIASLNGKPAPIISSGPGGDFQSLLEKLPPQMRRVLESYWLMVRPGGPCHPGDSYPAIYNLAKSLYDEESEDTEIGAILRGRFPDRFPKIAAWTKQLNHAEAKFVGQTDAETILRSLGLFRR